jgi:hypothetical protein
MWSAIWCIADRDWNCPRSLGAHAGLPGLSDEESQRNWYEMQPAIWYIADRDQNCPWGFGAPTGLPDNFLEGSVA